MSTISSQKKTTSFCSIRRILPLAFGWLIAFYLGVNVGMMMAHNTQQETNPCTVGNDDQQQQQRFMVEPKCPPCPKIQQEKTSSTKFFEAQQQRESCPRLEESLSKVSSPRFPDTVNIYAKGAALVDKDEFLAAFDTGIPDPLGGPEPSARDVLLIYQSSHAFPKKSSISQDAQKARIIISNKQPRATVKSFPKLPVKTATENCDVLHVVATKPMYGMAQCLALVGQVESHHLTRFMRIDSRLGAELALNSSLPLTRAGRAKMPSGRDDFEVPSWNYMKRHLKFLHNYFDQNTFEQKRLHLGKLLHQMTGQEPIVEPRALSNREKRAILQQPARFQERNNAAVVVMVCNQGQAELLINFVCHATAKGIRNLDKTVLVFCTDMETYHIAQGLGLNAYYDEKNFKDMPKQAARAYGDIVFRELMMAKAMVAQIINILGYDVLFQDVDIVWNSHPLDYFSKHYLDWDMLFQDDGARSLRFAPYQSNSGFYYTRYNEKTRYALLSLLYQGDLISSTQSHQQGMMAVLAELSSLIGLKVKTMPGKDFPCGYHFNRVPDYMKKLARGTLDPPPTTFHMSWTLNHVHKVQYMQQLGFWYTQDKCTVTKANKNKNGGQGMDATNITIASCCLAKPTLQCHYSDKPSAIPCRNFPKMERNAPDFWAGEGIQIVN